MLSKNTSPFVVDGPFSISARDGAPGSQFCVRHQARSIDDLRKIGAIPRFIDVEVVKRAVEKVTNPAFATASAQRRLQDELDQLRSSGQAMTHRTEAFNKARLDQLTVDVQVDGVVEVLDKRIARPVRRKVAVKAVDLARAGSYAVTSFELDRDMDVRAALIFDAGIGMCRAQDIRVYAGAIIESRAPHFILHARSLRGAWRSAVTSGDAGTDGDEGTKGGDGAPGRDAVCVGVFSSDLTPTNGHRGGDAGDGSDGVDGGAGSDGGDLEQHLEVLVSGMVVDTSGGKGGQGGKGGKGGPGGNGKGCEPSGLGGRGGDGGPGGDGGKGGKGGDAGDLFIYYVSDQSAGKPPSLTATGGAYGPGGLAGLGGEAGEAGSAGPESKYGKKRWDPPPAGGPGAAGATGAPGSPGAVGKSKTPVLEAVPLV